MKDASEGAEIQAQVGQWYEGETDFKIAGNIGLPLTSKGFINLNVDLAYPLGENVNLATGLEWRQESYTMFQGDEQSWRAGPWASVGLLIDPNTKRLHPGSGVDR